MDGSVVERRPARRAIPRAWPLRRGASDDNRSVRLTIEASLFVACLVTAWFLSATFVDPWWSIVAIALFLWMSVLFVRVQPRGAVLATPLLIAKSSDVAALAFIAFGASIPELGTVGEPSGAACAFVFYTAVSVAAYVAAFSLFDRHYRSRPHYPLTPLFDRYANLLAIGLLAVSGIMILDLLIAGARTGFPLLTGTDRLLYRRVMADKWTVYILNFKSISSFLFGFVAFAMPAHRIFSLGVKLAFAVLMILYFLFGDKFFTMLGSSAAFFAPYLYLNSRSVLSNVGKYALLSIAALTILFSITWYIYSEGGRQNSAATADKLSGRIVGQGELWFLQYNLGAPIATWDTQQVRKNVQALTIKDVDLFALRESLGPAYFSNKYAPDKIRASLHRNAGSVTYTQALEPLAVEMFGWAGAAIVMAIAGVLMALSTIYMAMAIRYRSIIMGTFATYVFVQLMNALSQGTPWVIFSVFSLKWLAVILVLELCLLALGASQERVAARVARMAHRPAPRPR